LGRGSLPVWTTSGSAGLLTAVSAGGGRVGPLPPGRALPQVLPRARRCPAGGGPGIDAIGPSRRPDSNRRPLHYE
jgi:hypothetical protein